MDCIVLFRLSNSHPFIIMLQSPCGILEFPLADVPFAVSDILAVTQDTLFTEYRAEFAPNRLSIPAGRPAAGLGGREESDGP